MSAAPILSVLIALQRDGASPEACIESLLAQADDHVGMEILVVDGTATGWRPATPDARVERLSAPPGSSLPRLLGRGLAAARGRLVAFTEAHVTFEPGWVSRALALDSQPEIAAIGGVVMPGPGLGAIDRAVFLCDYAEFLPPVGAGEAISLPGCNVVFHRQALESVERLDEAGFWKTFHCQELLRCGATLALDPALGCRHHLRLSVGGWLHKRWVHGRCYGGSRRGDWSTARRAIYAVVAPLVPFVLLGRTVRRIWPRADYRWSLVTHSPLCLLAITLWVAGEWTGNLVGPGRSCREV